MKLVIDIDEEDYNRAFKYVAVHNIFADAIANGTPLDQVIKDIKGEIKEEKEYAYADFDEYNNEILGFDDTDICERDLYHIGLGRALQIINKHISGETD